MKASIISLLSNEYVIFLAVVSLIILAAAIVCHFGNGFGY